MKRKRLALIRKIVEENKVATQEELTALLQEQGENVTQATVSRDIKEMMLVKVHDGVGSYHYVCPSDNLMVGPVQIQKNLQNSIISLAANDMMVVVRTHPGAAGFVASILDKAKWGEVLGTIAGDDTVFVALRSPEVRDTVVKKLKELKN